MSRANLGNVRWSRVLAACGAAVFVSLVSLGVGMGVADAAVTPDSACGNESSFKSISGTTTASLQIINNTGETLQSFWLDYNGARVFYKQIAPFTSYVQPTWLTHPWIVANAQGACYRFVVMNSVQQTVTVNADAAPTQTAPPPSSTARSASPGGTRNQVAGQSGSESASGREANSSFPTVPVVGGAVAVLLAAIGGLAATGHLPGFAGFGGSTGSGAGSSSADAPGMNPSSGGITGTVNPGMLNALGINGQMISELVGNSTNAAAPDFVSSVTDALINGLTPPSPSPNPSSIGITGTVNPEMLNALGFNSQMISELVGNSTNAAAPDFVSSVADALINGLTPPSP